jgi:hypothetical protein
MPCCRRCRLPIVSAGAVVTVVGLPRSATFEACLDCADLLWRWLDTPTGLPADYSAPEAWPAHTHSAEALTTP